MGSIAQSCVKGTPRIDEFLEYRRCERREHHESFPRRRGALVHGKVFLLLERRSHEVGHDVRHLLLQLPRRICALLLPHLALQHQDAVCVVPHLLRRRGHQGCWIIRLIVCIRSVLRYLVVLSLLLLWCCLRRCLALLLHLGIDRLRRLLRAICSRRLGRNVVSWRS